MAAIGYIIPFTAMPAMCDPKKEYRWEIARTVSGEITVNGLIDLLLSQKGLIENPDSGPFLKPVHPLSIPAAAAGIDPTGLARAVKRITKAIKKGESIVVYADYDADGITAGAVMWETIHKLGGKVMPYIPHRTEEGYGLSEKGIASVKKDYDATLIVTVDHGITGFKKVEYAKSLGIETIITDHHVKPDIIPSAITVHTTLLSGSGISWFVARQLEKDLAGTDKLAADLLAIAAIGTIADMVPLTGVNRSLVRYGLLAIRETKRPGIIAIFEDAGINLQDTDVYSVSHSVAPRLNAMGRLTHALDALRLLCTGQTEKAKQLAMHLGNTNRDRQQLTQETTLHANTSVSDAVSEKIIVTGNRDYNPGIIGLVAGRLAETWYKPAIVFSVGEELSKASARSVPGFNIIEVLRQTGDLLVEVGGHPMAAGFTIRTADIPRFTALINNLVSRTLTAEMLIRKLKIDLGIPLTIVSEKLWQSLADFSPFGIGNPEPVFATAGVQVLDARPVGAEGKHLKLRVGDTAGLRFDAIAFGLGGKLAELKGEKTVDLAYTVSINEWNGKRAVQLKVRDFRTVSIR